MTTGATKITVYPPGPVAENSPVQSIQAEPGDEVEWTYMRVGTVNYVYGYTVIKPVNLYKAGEQIKRLARG